MGVLGCLQFAVKFFLDFLAWPLLALGYPLCASIKAIETNSVSDTQKLNTYWVVFSLILLFEHASAKLLQWFSFWPYIRLMIVCLLVIPYFDGASYVYKHLFCYCLSLDSQIVINWFNKWMESLFKREKLPAEVASFVKENGTEALEKLITSKSNGTSNFEAEEIKAVSSIEFKLVNKVNQVEPNLVWTENQIVATGESKKTVPEIAAGRQELLQTSASKPVQKEWTCENLIIATGETRESLPEIAVGREELPQTSASKPVQKEWTCNICNVTTQSELVFNSHLQGEKHNDKIVMEIMKAKNERVMSEKTEVNESKAIPCYENKGVTQSNLNEPDVEPVVVLEKNEVTTVSQVSQAEPNIVQTEKQIIATVETIETVADVAPGRELPQTSNPVEREWTCSMCKVTAHCETVFISHLQGKKHKKAVFETMKLKNQTDVPKIVPSSTPKKSAQPSVQHANTSKNQTVQPKFGLSNIQKKFDHSGQSNPKNISPSSAAKKPCECKEAKVRGQQQKNQNTKTVAQNGLSVYCSLCNVTCTSKVDMASHLRGRRHLMQVQIGPA
ncbi:hypothetical protein UlMin_032461 [Ulmus minor]